MGVDIGRAGCVASARSTRAAVLILLGGLMFGAYASAPSVRGLTDDGSLGLYRTEQFRLTNGRCEDCATIPQALWYFKDDTVAVPTSNASAFTRQLRAQDDVKRWALERASKPDGGLPPLVWVGSPQVASSMRLSDDGAYIKDEAGRRFEFSVVEKIPSNLSFYDASSVKHLAGRPLRMRGTLDQGKFVARTIWPEDYAFKTASTSLQPLKPEESISSLVRGDRGGPTVPFSSRILWQKNASAPLKLNGKPVLAFMLNGAQGDDDEAHGGHFAIATGVIGARGEWGDWLVNNFYNLDSVSEKGIIASTLPMDAYMADLNSGQSWYRPSYMLVAVLKQDRAAGLYQEAINRVFNHFYRHDFHYRHTSANCAGVSMETLRSLGWEIPKEGATSHLKAIAALPYMSIKDQSIESGRKAYDYLVAEKTDLYPFVAFDAAGRDLLQRISAGKANTPFEKMLSEDIEALVYVHIPQFPSSRAYGQAPVASIDEYMQRTPEDRSQWKIIPVPPRPFPPELKDPGVPNEESLPSQMAMYAYGGFFGIAAVGVWRRRSRKCQSK